MRKRTMEQWRAFRRTPTGILHTCRANAKRRGISFKIERVEFIEWFKQQDFKCFYCHCPLKLGSPRNNSTLTFDRLDNTKGYTLNNIVLACLRCNRVKTDVFTPEQMLEVAQKYFKPPNPD